MPNFYTCLFPIVVSIPSIAILVEILVFNKQHDQEALLLSNSSLILLFIMWALSYYQSIAVKNSHSTYSIMPKRKLDTSQYNSVVYQNTKTCDRDSGRFKPVRTSHCHACGCVLRMVIAVLFRIITVLGLIIAAFIIFSACSALLGWHYHVNSFKYYFYLKKQEVGHSTLFYVFWAFYSIIGFLLTISLTGLSVTQTLMAARNVTTLDIMKRTFKISRDPRKPNCFDFGNCTNLALFFEYDTLFWWLPKETITQNDGTEFPLRPQVTTGEVQALPQNLRQDLKSEQEKDMPRTLSQLRERYAGQYKNAVFFYLDEQYKLDEESEQAEPASMDNTALSEEDKQLLEDVYS